MTDTKCPTREEVAELRAELLNECSGDFDLLRFRRHVDELCRSLEPVFTELDQRDATIERLTKERRAALEKLAEAAPMNRWERCLGVSVSRVVDHVRRLTKERDEARERLAEADACIAGDLKAFGTDEAWCAHWDACVARHRARHAPSLADDAAPSLAFGAEKCTRCQGLRHVWLGPRGNRYRTSCYKCAQGGE